ncbi:MAG: hypothetical protein ACTSWM_02535, partial [Alphaproteobacteria bacterium]
MKAIAVYIGPLLLAWSTQAATSPDIALPLTTHPASKTDAYALATRDVSFSDKGTEVQAGGGLHLRLKKPFSRRGGGMVVDVCADWKNSDSYAALFCVYVDERNHFLVRYRQWRQSLEMVVVCKGKERVEAVQLDWRGGERHRLLLAWRAGRGGSRFGLYVDRKLTLKSQPVKLAREPFRDIYLGNCQETMSAGAQYYLSGFNVYLTPMDARIIARAIAAPPLIRYARPARTYGTFGVLAMPDCSFHRWPTFLNRLGYSYNFFTPADIDNGRFENFKVLCFPGGAWTLNKARQDAIVKAVKAGKGYIGICRGLRFAAKKLKIIKGQIYRPEGKGILHVKINPTSAIMRGLPPVIYMRRHNGAFIIPGPDAEVLATVDEKDQYAAAIANTFGKGRVLVIGPHPDHLGYLKFLDTVVRVSPE